MSNTIIPFKILQKKPVHVFSPEYQDGLNYYFEVLTKLVLDLSNMSPSTDKTDILEMFATYHKNHQDFVYYSAILD